MWSYGRMSVVVCTGHRCCNSSWTCHFFLISCKTKKHVILPKTAKTTTNLRTFTIAYTVSYFYYRNVKTAMKHV